MSKIFRFAVFSVALADSQCSFGDIDCPISVGSSSLLAKSHDGNKFQDIMDELKDKSVLEKSEALVKHMNDKATPMIQKMAKEQLDMIEGMMKPAIVEYHEEADQTIQERVNALRSALMMASTSLKVMVRAEKDEKTCHTELEQCTKQCSDCDTDEEEVKKTMETTCKILPGVQFYSSKDSAHHEIFPLLQCDFSKAGACTKNYGDWMADVQVWANKNIKNDVDKGQAAWDVAKKECDDAIAAHEAKVEECRIKQKECDDKKDKCTRLEKEKDISICILGDKLKEKCDAKAAYDEIIRKVKGSNNVFSHSDRVAEWANTLLSECMWKATSEAKLFGMVELQACSSTIDYAEQVGTLRMQEDTVEQLMKAHPFPFGCDDYPKCEELSKAKAAPTY